jgi:hypothetical protein
MTPTRLDPDALTPEGILAKAEARRVKLKPGFYFQCDDGGVVACCPVGLLALELDDTSRSGIYAERALAEAGLSREFTAGVTEGFDGHAPVADARPEFTRGFTLGRATRATAGIGSTAS